jgi:hypothetical protein
MNVLVGTILESFAELRSIREEREYLSKTRCFICDIEKSRFDMKANEGITFEKHISYDHLIWNYVNFLVFLFFFTF